MLNTTKEEKFFSQNIWYHGTTLAEWKSICRLKIRADYNIGYSLDFGNGFYLTPNESDAQKFALDTVKYNGSELPDDNIPVVLVFNYLPINDILSNSKYKYFAKYDDEFATFVFNCRENYQNAKSHSYDITGGVMTDGIPTAIMQQYFAEQITKEQAIGCLKKGTSKKQLCLHTQELCDKLILQKAYIINGKELDVYEYTK